MLKNKNPISFHILEKECRKPLMTWTYPFIKDDIKTFIISRCFSVTPVPGEIFFCLRRSNTWIYVRDFVNRNGAPIALIVIAEDIDLSKYKILTEILAKKYLKTHNPVDLVKLYLNLIVSGAVCYQENGSEISLNLSNRPETKIKGIIKDFGLEIILLYSAILLKRRILIYHNNIETLQQKLLAIANLVPIRNPNEFLYPLIENVQELKGTSFYLAGTIAKNQNLNEKYYDLYVTLASNEITISKEAKDHFVPTKIHKDLAHVLIQLSQSDLSEAKVISEINSKTNDILKHLNSIATCEVGKKKMLSLQDLKSKKFNQNLENFLFNLAVAENIMLL